MIRTRKMILVSVLFITIGFLLFSLSSCQAIKSFIHDHKGDFISIITDIVKRVLDGITKDMTEKITDANKQDIVEKVEQVVIEQIKGINYDDEEIKKIISTEIDNYFNKK